MPPPQHRFPTKTSSPIRNLSEDILRQIFIQCNAAHLLRVNRHRPKRWYITNAPMVLCHVSSSWREIALGSPVLWSRLHFVLTVQLFSDRYSRDWAVLKHDIEFILWWQKNRATSPLFLVLDIKKTNNIRFEKLVTGGGMDIILHFLSTAQCLNVDLFLWRQIQARLNSGRGYRFRFSNLQTLVSIMDVNSEETRIPGMSFYEIQKLISHSQNTARPTLRYLRIKSDTIQSVDNIIPAHWTFLTHISFSDVTISFDIWYSLTRSTPRLTHGFFSLNYPEVDTDAHPQECVLHQLKTLSLTVNCSNKNTENPLRKFLSGLFFPTLTKLSLYSNTKSWKDHRATAELSSILDYTPNITSLTLGTHFSSFELIPNPINLLTALHSPSNARSAPLDPLWTQLPSLTDLHLEIPYTRTQPEAEVQLATFIDNVFAPSNKWLDAHNLECSIQTITIIDNGVTWAKRFREAHIYELSLLLPRIKFGITLTPSRLRDAEMWRLDFGDG
ncbi:hypothetical protein BDN70DRAFT_894185 [Pholiota conissans]|uniref:F-box domain-containing protein n=1 Tax=Pholiota conissans TaxID=109636 RepID=A0A9P6D1H7_9AGAR|nr:hypothetical protein BDN70DRAFT_894185 [Pholiota conissans]